MFFNTAFRLDISKSVGLGHYKRLSILKERLKINPIWILSGDKKIINKFFKNKNFYYIKNYNSEIKIALEIKKSGIQKIIFDIANNDFIKNNKNIKLINLYKKQNFKTISFDIPGQKKVSDISIIPYDFYSEKKNIRNKKIFVGSKYLLHKKNFVKNNLPKKIKKILISIGGSDFKSIGIKLLKHFKSENFQIRLLVGLNKYNYINDKKFKLIKFEHNMEKHFSWCDMVICGEGLTKFEAINYNKPTIIIHQFDVASKLIKSFLKQQTCLSLGLYNKKKLNDYKNLIISYINDKTLQAKHMKNQNKLFNRSIFIKKQKMLLDEINNL